MLWLPMQTDAAQEPGMNENMNLLSLRIDKSSASQLNPSSIVQNSVRYTESVLVGEKEKIPFMQKCKVLITRLI